MNTHAPRALAAALLTLLLQPSLAPAARAQALILNPGATVISGTTFLNNTAPDNSGGIGGGAIYSGSATFDLTLNDVSFIGNTSAADGARGGAIGILNPSGDSNLNINVTSGVSYFAGNTYSVAIPASSGIAVSQNTLFTTNINIFTEAGATLDMLDPFYVSMNANNATANISINKTGAGTWNLAGDNTLDKTGNNGVVSLNINAGALYLYRAGEQVNVPGLGTATAATGNIAMTGATANAPARFYLAAGASLGVGGGNKISISSATQSAGQWITLAQGSILSYDIAGASAAGLGLDASSPLLSLVSTGLNSTFDIFNTTTGAFNFSLNFDTLVTGSYNLLFVTKGAANVPYLTTSGTPASASNAFLGLSNGAGTWQQALLDSVTYGAGTDPDIAASAFTVDAAGNLWVTFIDTFVPLPPHAGNTVLTWAGSTNRWIGAANWLETATPANPALVFNQGDIVNFDSTNPASNALRLADSATASAIYFSGANSYALAGAGNLVADAASGAFSPATDLAATGKLTLGATALSPTSFILSTFSGTLDLTGLTGAPDNFTTGIEINSGALRVSNSAQLGIPDFTSDYLNFTGTGALIIAANGALAFDNNAAPSTPLLIGDAATTVSATILAESGASLTIARASSAANGGAIAIAANSTLTLAGIGGGGFLFDSNTAALAGGAISADGAVVIANATFLNNTSLANTANIGGGAFYSGSTAVDATFNNVSFIGNTSAADGARGGAIGILNPTADSNLNINVTTGTSYFAGNTYGTTTPAPNGIAIAQTTLFTTNINLFTETGAALDMLDPFYAQINANNAAAIININKTGAGVWNLAGDNTLDKTGNNGVINLNINAGTLHLYRAGEQVTVPGIATPVSAATGNITLMGATANAPVKFYLAPGANLSIGGGNKIAVSSPTQSAQQGIAFAPGSILTYDIAGAFTAGLGGATTPLLSLVSTGLNSGFDIFSTTTGTFNFTLDFATWVPGSYNLLSVTKGAANVPYLSTSGTPANANNAFLGLENGVGIWQQSLLDSITYQTAAPTDGPASFYLDAAGNLWVTFPGTPPVLVVNNVLAWTGATDNSWLGAGNWKDAVGADAKFTTGDIVNLADDAALATCTIALDTSATTGGMYVSGTTDYIITGAPIVATSASVGATFDPATVLAATGKLVIGGSAASDGLTYATSGTDNTVAYQGTLTLDNTSNDFQNGIDIYSGALTGNAANLGAGGAGGPGIKIYAGGTLTFNQTTEEGGAGNATYTAPIAGTAHLDKTGAAALTLDADNSAFTGQTTIRAGSLLLAPAAKLGGAITVNDTARLAGGAGAIAGSVTLADNSALQIGIGSTGAQIFTIDGNLTLGALATDTSILDFTVLTNKLIVNGSIIQTGLSTINVATANPGTTQLINVLGTGGITAANFDLSKITVSRNNVLLDPSSYTLGIANNWLTIFFEGHISQILTWTGAASNAWNTSSRNWTTVETTSTVTAFTDGDIVNFTASTSDPININIAAPVTAGAMYVGGSAAYAFTGAGITTDADAASLIGAAINGKLVLGKTAATADTLADAPFTATLDLTGITGSNTFAGGIDLYSGAIRVANAGQLGTTLSNVSLLGSATLAIAAGGSAIFDDNNALTNQLVVGDILGTNLNTSQPRTFTIIAEPGATFAIKNSGGNGAAWTNSGTWGIMNSWSSTNGGAIVVAPLAGLVLSGTLNGAGGGFLFESNTSQNAGGAISINGFAWATIDSATFNNNSTSPLGAVVPINGGAITVDYSSTLTVLDSVFSGNVARAASVAANGGALASTQGSTINVTNVLFTSNSATRPASQGGAIYGNTGGGNINVYSSTFIGNFAGNNGGAIGIPTSGPVLYVENSLFESNTSTGASGGFGGGAIFIGNAITGTIVNTTFVGNVAVNPGNDGSIVVGGGGAIAAGNTSTGVVRLTLVDVDFYDNHSGGIGGALSLYGNNSVFNYNVSDGLTSYVAGNTYSIDCIPSGLYFDNNTSKTMNFTVGQDGFLNTLDPTFWRTANTSTDRISKLGPGTWNFGGSGTFYPNAATPTSVVNFDISEGIFHLYRAGEVSYKGVPVQAGGLVSCNNGGGTPQVNFTLHAGATLSAGGGNSIMLTNITLEADSTITLDLLGVAPNSGIAVLAFGLVPAPNFVTPGALTPNGWTQNLDLLNFDSLSPYAGDVFNLITIASGGVFTSANTFNLVNPLPDGFVLQLSADSRTLQLLCQYFTIHNSVLTWNNTNGDNAWLAYNWTAAGTGTNFHTGDIINLVDAPAATPDATPDITVNTPAEATVAGLYVSGTDNHTLTGNSIIASADSTETLAGATAATGKLILGARASNDAASIDALAYTGTLTFANTANDFQGGIEINGGALVGNAATLGSGTVGITLADGATLTFDQIDAEAAYAAPITGAGSLVKTGSGALTLTNASTAITGDTQVDAGRLLLDKNVTLGSVDVAPAATFGGIGAATGDISIVSGATLQIGLDQTGGQTLTLGNLTLADSARLDYTTLADTLHITGSLAQTGSTAINLGLFIPGTYNLGNLAPLYGNIALSVLDEPAYPDARQQAFLSTNGDDLILTAVGDISRIITWTGAINNVWARTGSDWNDPNPGPAQSHGVFGNGDRVIFNDDYTAAPAAITIVPAGVIVSDMIVDGATNYTFTGGAITANPDSIFTGSILATGDGAGKLTKNGAGALTLANISNTFPGGIDLNQGAIIFSGTNTTATPLVTASAGATLGFAGGALEATTARFAAGSSLSGSGTFNFGTLALNGNITAGNAAGDILILTGNYDAAPGASIVKTGAGELRFDSTIGGYAGITQVNGGIVSLAGITGITGSSAFVIPNSTNVAITTDNPAGGTITTNVSYALYDYNPATTSFVVPAGIYNINGLAIFVPSQTISIADTISDLAVSWTAADGSLSGRGYQGSWATLPLAGSATLSNPGGSATVGGSTIEVPASTYVISNIAVTFPGGNAYVTTDGAQVYVETSGSLKISGHNFASEVNQSFLLNGGTLAFTGTGALSESSANDWAGIAIVPGPNAAQSAVSGVNDIIHVGAGSVDYALMGGLIVAINAPGATTVFTNTTSTFTGFLRVDSGTLQLTTPDVLGVASNGTTKIALNGGALQLSASGTYTGDLQLHSPVGTVVVDDEILVNWGAITKNSAVPQAEFVKAGSGTLVVNGNNAATSMHITQGRYVACAFNSGNSIVTATVDAGAVFELSATATVSSTVIGQVGGVDFTTTNPGSSNTAYAGSGTLLVSQGRVQLTSAQTTIDHILITGSDTAVMLASNHPVASYSPNGAIIVDQGSLVLGCVSQILGNVTLKNNATLGFFATTGTATNNLAFKTASLNSLAYEGPGAGNLYFNSNLSIGRADQMTVAKPITGNFNLLLTNYGALPSKYFGAMELIHAPDSPDFHVNILNENSEIEAGLYKYTIAATTNAGVTSILVTGTGALGNSAAAINAVAAALPVTWFAELESVTQRMGELRMEPRDIAGGPAVWLRGYGDRYNYNNRITGTPFGERHLGAEAGIDYKINKARNDRNLYAGVFFGYGNSDRSIAPNQSTSDSFFGGIYQTLFSTKTGIYFDALAKFNTFKNKFTILSPTGESTTASYNNWAIGGSLELGCNFALKYGFFIEPQAQLAGAMFNRATYQTAAGSDMLIELPQGSSVNARLGLRLGRLVETKNGTLSIYGKVYSGGQWTTRNRLYVTLPDAPGDRAVFDPYIQGIYIAGGGGVSWLFKKTNQIYVDFDTSQSSYYVKPWSFTAGFRHNW